MGSLARTAKGHWQLGVLCLAILILWQTNITYPLRLLVIFFHELSHVLATVLTGGSIEDFTISANEGGHVLSRGGNRFISLSAGYLGSLVIGIALLLVAVNTRIDRAAMALLGAVMLLVTALYIREPFAIGFCALTGCAMLLAARFFAHDVNDLFLRLIGLASMIYMPIDIFSDTISRSHLQSDARMLAEEFGGTTVFWGSLWLAISAATILVGLRYGLGKDSNLSFGRTPPAT